MKEALFALGAVFEFVGIILVGSPDFFPLADRVSRWLRTRYRRALDRVRRWIGRPRPQVIEVSGAGSIAMVGRASLVKSVSPEATLEERVASLVTRDQEAQRDMNEVRERIATPEQESSQRLDELRHKMEAHSARELAAAFERHRPIRVIGALALAIGLGLMTTANFV